MTAEEINLLNQIIDTKKDTNRNMFIGSGGSHISRKNFLNDYKIACILKDKNLITMQGNKKTGFSLIPNFEGIEKMKSIVKNPSPKKKTAARASNNREWSTGQARYVHRPKVITKSARLTTTKSGGTYKFNPAAGKFIKTFIKQFKDSGKYEITLNESDIKKFKKFLEV